MCGNYKRSIFLSCTMKFVFFFENNNKRKVLNFYSPRIAVAKGAMIASEPVSTGLPCLFTACAPVQIVPLEAYRAEMISRRDGRGALRLALSATGDGVGWKGLFDNPLRFY